MTDALATIRSGAESVQGVTQLGVELLTEYDILATQGSKPTRVKISHFADYSQVQFQRGEELDENVTFNPLHGHSILASLDNNTWNYRLIAEQPTADQREEIANYANNWERDIAPNRKVQIGESWIFSGEKLASILGWSGQAIDGRVEIKFEKVIDFNGEQCALLPLTFSMTAGLSNHLGNKVTMSGKGEIYRSLTTKIDIYHELKGSMKIDIEEVIDGRSIHTTIEGSFVATGSAAMDRRE